MLELVNGWDFKTAANEVDRVIGNSKTSAIIKTDTTAKRRKRLNALRLRIFTNVDTDYCVAWTPAPRLQTVALV